MPKMKSNRQAVKKLRINANGKAKHARASTNHNSGKKPAKRMRQLRGNAVVDKTNAHSITRVLPYSSKGKGR